MRGWRHRRSASATIPGSSSTSGFRHGVPRACCRSWCSSTAAAGSAGDRGDYGFVGRAFAARGFVTVIADYRLVPMVRFPTFIEDGARAVRWVRDHVATLWRRPAAHQSFGSFGGILHRRDAGARPAFPRRPAGRSGDRARGGAVVRPLRLLSVHRAARPRCARPVAPPAGDPADQLRPARRSADAADARHRRYRRAAAQFGTAGGGAARPSARPPSSSSIRARAISTRSSRCRRCFAEPPARSPTASPFSTPTSARGGGLKREVRAG